MTYDIKLNKNMPAETSKFSYYGKLIDGLEGECRRNNASYVVSDASLLPILTFSSKYEMNFSTPIYGPYCSGKLGGLPIIISPLCNQNEFILCNGNGHNNLPIENGDDYQHRIIKIQEQFEKEAVAKGIIVCENE